MTLEMEVGLGPVHIVLDGDSSPPQKGAEPPIFGPSLLWQNGWMHQDATWYGGRSRPSRLCVRWGPSPYPNRGGEFGPSLLWPNGWMHQDATWYGGRPLCGLRKIVFDVDPATPRKKGTPCSVHVYCGQINGWMDEDAAWYGIK